MLICKESITCIEAHRCGHALPHTKEQCLDVYWVMGKGLWRCPLCFSCKYGTSNPDKCHYPDKNDTCVCEDEEGLLNLNKEEAHDTEGAGVSQEVTQAG